MENSTVCITTGNRPYKTEIKTSGHSLTADEPTALGGGNTGPEPGQLLLASLGSCTAITMQMYAARKGWDLKKVQVELWFSETDENRQGIEKQIKIWGELDPEQKKRLLQIADLCPVHKLITQPLQINSRIQQEK